MQQPPDAQTRASDPSEASDAVRFQEMETIALGGQSPPDFDAAVALLASFRPANLPRIYLNQRVSEWKRFIQFLQDREFPRIILEIGTGRGGSTFFWSRFSPTGARIVTVDLAEQARRLVETYSHAGANPVQCITGDSRSPATVQSVRQALGGQPVDLLYIDGDHTYNGVKADFNLYRQFCGPASLIAFHDIHPDFFQARGIKTPCDSGLVHKFWDELKSGCVFREFVDEPRAEQDGFGIGVIEKFL